MKKQTFFLMLVLIVSMVSCAEPIDVTQCTQDIELYGFLGGLWHGFIAFFTFIGSLFMDDVAIYATNNTGGWYDFGFVLGAGILFGGGIKIS